MQINPRIKSIITAFQENQFSFVVNEVYGSHGSLTVKSVRCPGDIELARKINAEIQFDGVLRVDKADMLSAVQSLGFALVSAKKNFGMEHIYTFAPATAENPGLEPVAAFTQDACWVQYKRSEERLVNTFERMIAQ